MLDNSAFYAAANENLRNEVNYLSTELHEVREDLLKVSDAFDNIGWAPIPGEEIKELPLKTVKKIAEVARSMNAVNPFVKRGVEARISYIWGKGVAFDGVQAQQEKINEARKKLFTPQAYMEFERALATDGNVFTALPLDNEKNTQAAAEPIRIPLEQIVNAYSNPEDPEEIWYYKRDYTVKKTNPETGETRDEHVIKYYASLAYWQKRQKQGKKNLPRSLATVGVEQNYVIQHIAVNKQVGWRWGLPDIAAVIFWAKAYKEYLEDNAMLVKAYSRLAWQIKVPSGQAGAAASAQVMRAPTRDPITGELRDVGGTALTGLNQEMSPVSATGSTVDFSKGSALAAAIAAGLEVSLVVILSDSGASNRAAEQSLDLPTLKAMESRQQVHTDRFLDIFEFWGADIYATAEGSTKTKEANEAKAEDTEGVGSDVAVVTWPQIQSDSTKDRVTALGTAVELGVIYKQEARKELLDVFGLAPYKAWDDLPTMDDDPAAKEAAEKAEQDAEVAFQREQQAASVVAKQGVSGGVAAKGGTQTNSNSARTNRAKDSRNS